MFSYSIKKIFFSSNTLLILIIFLFLVFITYCGYLHHSNLECDVDLFFTNQTWKKYNFFIYAISLFSIIKLIAYYWKGYSFLLTKIFSPCCLIFLWFQEFVFKLYNPILKALSRGIIHSQTYNSLVVSA